MRTKTKALVLALCAVLLVVTTVFVTMAFLTSEDSVQNTFTVGKVEITLDEAKVDSYGNEIANAERVKENEYKLIPSHTYVKDPTIHVDSNSEDCYLFVKIQNDLGSDGVINGIANNGWVLVEGTQDVYCYYGVTDGETNSTKQIVKPGEDKKVFDTFTFGEKANPNNYDTATKNAKIIVTAYAIQADGLSEKTPAEIWALFK
ncbi:MAG: hypothetical protein IJC36_00720 [Clostridia bacterium]|nr:hypothetical protein [Clostridia bacterium]